MGNQSFVLGQINTRHNQREEKRQKGEGLILPVMDSWSKSVRMVLCKLRRHPSIALMIMGEVNDVCAPQALCCALLFFFSLSLSPLQPPRGCIRSDPLDGGEENLPGTHSKKSEKTSVSFTKQIICQNFSPNGHGEWSADSEHTSRGAACG